MAKTHIEVYKHRSAIQISNNVTLLQRRAWNVLLANALDDLMDKDRYKIYAKDLCEMLDYDSNDIDYIKQILTDLVGFKVEWNILTEDGNNEWGVAALLAEATYSNGAFYYSYGPNLRTKLYNPAMSARLNLELQNKFNSKHSLCLYELCCDYFEKDEMPWIKISDLRKLFGLGSDEYKRFKDFNAKIIKKSVDEINKITDLHIRVETRREGRKIAYMRFHLTKGSRPVGINSLPA